MEHSELNYHVNTRQCGEEDNVAVTSSSSWNRQRRRKFRCRNVFFTMALVVASSSSSYSLAMALTLQGTGSPIWQGAENVDREISSRRRRPRLHPPPLQNTRLEEEEDGDVREKLKYAARYTDVDTLRRTFGTNRNKLWGDFDPETTRRLYHVLLPRAMLELYRIEGKLQPQELAPLAFEARIAAKKYARERCVVPGRLFSMAFDGFRSWKNYGKWNAEGLSWEQIWQKYEAEVLSEDIEDIEDDMQVLTQKVCVKILEKACASNPLVDKMFLPDKPDTDLASDIARIEQILDQEMQQLLKPTNQTVVPQLDENTNRTFHLTPKTVAALRFLLQTKKQLLPPRPNLDKIRSPSRQILPERQRNKRLS
jgi:hypothetical protein